MYTRIFYGHLKYGKKKKKLLELTNSEISKLTAVIPVNVLFAHIHIPIVCNMYYLVWSVQKHGAQHFSNVNCSASIICIFS